MFAFLDTYPYLLPFIIFFGRIVDVTLGTLRIIFVSKGEKYLAPLIGFFEVLIWQYQITIDRTVLTLVVMLIVIVGMLKNQILQQLMIN